MKASIPAKGSFDNELCPTLGLTLYRIQREEKQQSKLKLNRILDRR